MSTPEELRSALEDALAEDPDDLAAHMAYADLLAEQGDPRGEFIQAQLALEDPARTPEERKRLQQRERELLDAHEKEWLGELAPILLGTPEQQRALFAAELLPRHQDRLEYTTENMHFRHGWRRGWLDRFECDNLTVEMARKLGRAPIARLLRSLVIRGDEGAGVFRYTPGSDLPHAHGFRPCEVLAHYPAITNVRIFQYGTEVDPEEDIYYSGTQFDRLAPLVGRMPRLEELYIFGHIYPSGDRGLGDIGRLFSFLTLADLRILQYYHGHAYPLEALAANPALGRLTHLLCFPHDFAAEYDTETDSWGPTAISRDGVRAVVTSPYLTSLTHLQLRCCDGGDPMVADIAASGILGRLRMLDLRHGHVTDEGARLLASCPDAKNLEVLDLTNNRLTEAGVAALRDAGISVRADRQQTEPYDPEHILCYGDME